EEIIRPKKEGFRAVSVMPTKEDLLGETPEDLPYNDADLPYENVESYLVTHFKLLKEDCVRPLREGIRMYRSGKYRIDDTDMRIYEKVCIGFITERNCI